MYFVLLNSPGLNIPVHPSLLLKGGGTVTGIFSLCPQIHAEVTVVKEKWQHNKETPELPAEWFVMGTHF